MSVHEVNHDDVDATVAQLTREITSELDIMERLYSDAMSSLYDMDSATHAMCTKNVGEQLILKYDICAIQ